MEKDSETALMAFDWNWIGIEIGLTIRNLQRYLRVRPGAFKRISCHVGTTSKSGCLLIWILDILEILRIAFGINSNSSHFLIRALQALTFVRTMALAELI